MWHISYKTVDGSNFQDQLWSLSAVTNCWSYWQNDIWYQNRDTIWVSAWIVSCIHFQNIPFTYIWHYITWETAGQDLCSWLKSPLVHFRRHVVIHVVAALACYLVLIWDKFLKINRHMWISETYKLQTAKVLIFFQDKKNLHNKVINIFHMKATSLLKISDAADWIISCLGNIR